MLKLYYFLAIEKHEYLSQGNRFRKASCQT